MRLEVLLLFSLGLGLAFIDSVYSFTSTGSIISVIQCEEAEKSLTELKHETQMIKTEKNTVHKALTIDIASLSRTEIRVKQLEKTRLDLQKNACMLHEKQTVLTKEIDYLIKIRKEKEVYYKELLDKLTKYGAKNTKLEVSIKIEKEKLNSLSSMISKVGNKYIKSSKAQQLEQNKLMAIKRKELERYKNTTLQIQKEMNKDFKEMNYLITKLKINSCPKNIEKECKKEKSKEIGLLEKEVIQLHQENRYLSKSVINLTTTITRIQKEYITEKKNIIKSHLNETNRNSYHQIGELQNQVIKGTKVQIPNQMELDRLYRELDKYQRFAREVLVGLQDQQSGTAHYSMHPKSRINMIDKFFNSTQLTNVRFVIQDRPIYAQKYILSEASSYMKAQFKGVWAKMSEIKIDKKDITYEVYKNYIYYLYYGLLGLKMDSSTKVALKALATANGEKKLLKVLQGMKH